MHMKQTRKYSYFTFFYFCEVSGIHARKMQELQDILSLQTITGLLYKELSKPDLVS